MSFMLACRLALQRLPRAVTSTTVNSRFRYHSTKADPHQATILRPYQEDCVNICLQKLAVHPRNIGVSLPTASGKTIISLHLAARLPPPATKPNATRVLIVVSSIELAHQTAKQARREFPHWTVEVDQGNRWKASGTADITIGTYQTLSRPGRLKNFSAEHTKVVIVDEAHHAAAASYRHILAHFSTAVDHPDPTFVPPAGQHQVPIVGFSATFSRFDGLALASVFEEVVYHRDVTEMIREGWLCTPRFVTVHAKMDLGGVPVNKRTGDFIEERLARVLDTGAMRETLVRAWQEKASRRKSTLVFCANLAHVSNVTDAFRAAGVDARAISSRTPAAERDALVADFRAGKLPVLVNCGVFTEGIDIPNIDCVVIARPTLSSNLLNQMIGRGMRQSPETGKTDCLVIDFADSKCHVAGLLSAPRFFGRDPAELDRRSPNDIREIAIRQTEERLERLRLAGRIPVVVYIDEDNPFDVPDQASGDQQLRALSWNNWIYCGEKPGFYLLETSPSGGTFSVSPVRRDDGVIEYVSQYSPYQHKARSSQTWPTLGEAIQYCDERALEWIGSDIDCLLRAATWRWESASDAQKEIIRDHLLDYMKLRKRDRMPLNPSALSQELDEMTKGTAQNIISRIYYEASTWKDYYEKQPRRQKQEDGIHEWWRSQFRKMLGL